MLADGYGRQFHYLRLSVTDKCNFRCSYCLPNGYQRFGQESPYLQANEIRRLLSALVHLGLWKVRLTGGEPTLRPDIVELVNVISSLEGIRRVALSTNGYRFSKIARLLRRAGLNSVNISVDSLDAQEFTAITGHASLSAIQDAVQSAIDEGFDSVKVNVVLLKCGNAHALDAYLHWIRDVPISVRFIELMQTHDNADYFARNHVSPAFIRERLEQDGWVLKLRQEGDGPAQEFRHTDYRGRIGIIAPYSPDFCKTCNRLRVSSQGALQLCLFGGSQYPLRHLLQTDAQRDALIAFIRQTVAYKGEKHDLHRQNPGMTRNFVQIGG